MRTYLQNTFELFALALQPPKREWMKAIASGELVRQMVESWNELELPSEAIESFSRDMASYEGRDETELLHELAVEATRLHYGDGQLVRNTEGLWRLNNEGREGVFIINRYAREVSDFMHSVGVVRAGSYNDSMDSIENECYFMSILASSPQYLIDAGKEPMQVFDQFMNEHMKLWVPGFCEQVCAEAKLLYYKAVCTLLKTFIESF